jgi:hypothetical protein
VTTCCGLYSYIVVLGQRSSGDLAPGISVSVELMHHIVVMATNVHCFRFVSLLLGGEKGAILSSGIDVGKC